MAVSSCQVVLFWFLVSGMAIIKKYSSAVLLCCEGYALQCFHLLVIIKLNINCVIKRIILEILH